MSVARQYGKAGKVARLVSSRRASGEHGAETASTTTLDDSYKLESDFVIGLKGKAERTEDSGDINIGPKRGLVQVQSKKKVDRKLDTAPNGPATTSGPTKSRKEAPTKTYSSAASTSSKNKSPAITNTSNSKPAFRTEAKSSPAVPKATRPPKQSISRPTTPTKRKSRPASSEEEEEIEEQPKKRLKRYNTATPSSPASTPRATSKPIKIPVTVPRRKASVESLSTVSNPESAESPTKQAARPVTPPPRIKPRPSLTTPGPKDLSFLFPSTPERSPKHVPVGSPTKGGLAKRMLARSRTEGSFTSDTMRSQTATPSSTSGTPSRTTSLPTFVEPSAKPAPPPVNSPVGTRPTQRTYSQSRSFLVEMPKAGASAQLPQDAIMQLDQELRQESYSDLRARYGVDDADDVTMNMPVNDLKSLTEMRAKGENRRLWDEIAYLFDGLSQDSPPGMKRASAVEIVRKMGDPDFVRRSKSADFFGHSWKSMVEAGAGNGSDKTLDACLAIICYVISRDSREAEELSVSPSFLDAMEYLLSIPPDKDALVLDPDEDEMVWARRIGITKLERTLLKEVRALARRHPTLDSTSLSSRSLASLTLVSVPSASLAAAITSHEPLRQPLLTTLLLGLNSELALIPKRIELFAIGVPLFPTPHSDATSGSSPSSPSSPTSSTPAHRTTSAVPDLVHIDNCLRVLETYLLRRVDSDPSELQQVEEQAKPLVKGLVTLLVACLSVLLAQNNDDDEDDEEGSIRSQASNCLETALRVLVNLTNRGCQDTNVDWCKLLEEQEHITTAVMRIIYSSYASRCGGFPSSSPFKDKGKGRESPVPTLQRRPAQATNKEEEIDDSAENEYQSQGEDEADAKMFDRLCLALALLTNLMQRDDSLKRKVLRTTFNPACLGRRSCIFACRCSKQTPALDCLVRIYQHWKSSGTRSDLTEAEDSFLRGHVAVLLGMLILLDPASKKSVLRSLSGTGEREKLDTIINTVLDFAAFYANITNKAARALGVEDPGDTAEGKADQIRRARAATVDGEDEMMDEGEEARAGGVEIASQVVRALRNLLDQAPS